jgi:DNA-binding IclR family transcriptional regulator
VGQPNADKALAILELFSEERPWLRVADVSRLLAVSDSTASRLLARLELRGFVERYPETGFYALGPRILALAGVAMNHSDVRRAALEEMYRLVHALGLGANLAVLRDGGVFYLGNLDGRHAPRYYTLLGRRYPLHATALGKVLLAWREPAEIGALVGAPAAAGPRTKSTTAGATTTESTASESSEGRLQGRLQRYTQSTIEDAAALVRHLALVRARGYATEVEELALGRACVAAPIRGRSGSVIAALSISGPVRIMHLEEREGKLAAAAVDAAMRISERLGFVMAPLDAVTSGDSSPTWQGAGAPQGGARGSAPASP